MKTIIVFVALAVIAIVVILGFQLTGNDTDKQVVDTTSAVSEPWIWENPYTFKQALVPAVWKQTENTKLQDTVLTLQHESGKSLVYILYEEPVDYMTLSEFIDVIKPLNQQEFGIDDFQEAKDKAGNNFYHAGSARYLGNSLVGIKVSIWSDGTNSFWEAVQMTDLEYKAIEYDAEEVVKLLIETTR